MSAIIKAAHRDKRKEGILKLGNLNFILSSLCPNPRSLLEVHSYKKEIAIQEMSGKRKLYSALRFGVRIVIKRPAIWTGLFGDYGTELGVSVQFVMFHSARNMAICAMRT